MKVDSTPSQVATSALQAIPFASIIGGPLDACIKAQAMAAKTTWEFIKEVGLQFDKEHKKNNEEEDATLTKKAINVSFTFVQNGNTVRLNIPLLTIIPIPFIAIQNVDIAFKASISAASSTAEEKTSNDQFNLELTEGGRFGWGLYGMKFDMKGGYSSKKDSRATQDSKYSVEYTMDVGIRAGQENMPAGLAKVLEILNSSLNVSDPKGILGVNGNLFMRKKDETIQLVVTYKNPEGLYEPEKISVIKKDDSNPIDNLFKIDSNSKIFLIKDDGIYYVKAGELSETIEIKNSDQTEDTTV